MALLQGHGVKAADRPEPAYDGCVQAYPGRRDERGWACVQSAIKLVTRMAKSGKAVRAAALHAQPAVNLAGAMATSLVETWAAKKS